MTSIRLSTAELDALNARFKDATPDQILAFAHRVFGNRAAILSSMQRTDAVLTHMANAASLDFDVLFVDTGVLHPETLATRARIIETQPKMRVRSLSPARSFADQTKDEGVLYLTKEGQERCCDLRKSDPLRAVKDEYDALLSALRASEGGARARVQHFALDADLNVLRVHPFAALPSDGIDKYLAAHPDVPVNPLHLMGFPTIGCFPCTSPVRDDETARAGRWRHLAGVEYCGINPVDRAADELSIQLPGRYQATLLAGA